MLWRSWQFECAANFRCQVVGKLKSRREFNGLGRNKKDVEGSFHGSTEQFVVSLGSQGGVVGSLRKKCGFHRFASQQQIVHFQIDSISCSSHSDQDTTPRCLPSSISWRTYSGRLD
jgi:hypothetical protein